MTLKVTFADGNLSNCHTSRNILTNLLTYTASRSPSATAQLLINVRDHDQNEKMS